ncbi:MAG: hypothetical protein WC605_09295 [Bacteroidales bacterium]
MDIPDNIYYYLSTIPQVLGAAFAFLGVFAIFKIQGLTTSRSGSSQIFLNHVRRVYSDGLLQIDALNQAQIGHNYEGTITAMTDLINFFTPMALVNPLLYNTAEMIGWRTDFRNTQTKIRNIKNYLISCLCYTVLLISVNLYILLDLRCFELVCLMNYLYVILGLTILNLAFMIFITIKSL